MRFEVAAAFVLGVLLPVLETMRRGIGFWGVDATTMLEDYLAGAVLVGAGWAAARKKRFGTPLLLVAWSGVTAMMTLSLLSQIEDTVRAEDLEPHNPLVLCGKVMLWLVCAAALTRSFRATASDNRNQAGGPP